MTIIREIALDTETTGLDPLTGHRIVEIGCVELINHLPSGNTYQVYLNPDRKMDERAQKITGIQDSFLTDKPRFFEVVDEFLNFIGTSTLIIHNAPFDMKFINAELTRIKKPLIGMDRTIDTLVMFKRLFPGSPASLDALCKRFEVDNKIRTYHGALLDATLLSHVYLYLIGGRQPDLKISIEEKTTVINNNQLKYIEQIKEVRSFIYENKTQELSNHKKYINDMKEPLWKKIDEFKNIYE